MTMTCEGHHHIGGRMNIGGHTESLEAVTAKALYLVGRRRGTGVAETTAHRLPCAVQGAEAPPQTLEQRWLRRIQGEDGNHSRGGGRLRKPCVIKHYK